MPRYNQTSLSMVGSSGITVVNTIKIAGKNADSARTTSETAPLFPCFCVWRSQREFLCFVSTFPRPAGAAVAIWSCFSKTLVLFNSFFSFPCLFLTFFLLRWCSPKVHFVFQHSLFFSAFVYGIQKMLCILQVAQTWSYWSNSRGTASYRGKSGLLAPLGISVLMCSPFWNPPSFHPICSELAGKWKSQASALHLFVCTSKCSKGQNLCLCCSWIYYFVPLFLPWRVARPRGNSSKI